MTENNDRLEEIKQRWCEWIKIIRTTGTWVNMEKPSGVQDVEWLIAEVERLRQERGEAQEEPGEKEWKARAAVVRGVHLSCLDREIVYADGRPFAKAIAAYVAAVLNAVQSKKASSKHPVQFEYGVLCGALLTDLYDAMQAFNAGEGA